MKNILTAILFVCFVSNANAQTINEVLDNYYAASGGKEKLKAINTFQYDQLVNLSLPNGMELEFPITMIRENNKFFRMQISSQFGDVFTIVTQNQGYQYLPANPFGGGDAQLISMKKEEYEALAYQMDADGMFGMLVNYESKGNKVSLMGSEKVNKEDCYKVKLTLKTNQELIYFISKSSNLIIRMQAKGEIGQSMSGLGAAMSSFSGGRRNKSRDSFEMNLEYTGYKDFDGFKLPTKLIIKAQMGDVPCVLSNYKINKPIDSKWYKAQ
jgi:hypothetical protein